MIDRYIISENQYIFDKVTQLYWRQSPLQEPMTWQEAVEICSTQGARLPTIQEWVAFLDYSQFEPSLPKNHPFTGVQSHYWSSSTCADDMTFAWFVLLSSGYVYAYDKTGTKHVWPVREKAKGEER